MIHYLGYFAGVLTVASFLPQVIRTWRTRHTRDLSLGMFALLVTASTLWIIYGIVIGNWPSFDLGDAKTGSSQLEWRQRQRARAPD